MKPLLVAKWHDGKRWVPLDRVKAARMIRGNRSRDRESVTRSGSETYIRLRGYDVEFTILKMELDHAE